MCLSQAHFRADYSPLSSSMIRDLKETMAIFDKYKPTHVIHLAALVGGLFKNMKYKLTFLRDNCLINDNVMWASKEHGVSLSRRVARTSLTNVIDNKLQVKKLISCLSTCVFPDKVTYPIDESHVHLGPPHDSNFGYAHGKRLVDVYNQLSFFPPALLLTQGRGSKFDGGG